MSCGTTLSPSGDGPSDRRPPIRVRDISKTLGIDVSISTVSRWMTKGVRGVRLKATNFGGRVFVLSEDLEAFINALNTHSDREPLTVRRTRRVASQVPEDVVPEQVEARLDAIFGTRGQGRKAGQKGGKPMDE